VHLSQRVFLYVVAPTRSFSISTQASLERFLKLAVFGFHRYQFDLLSRHFAFLLAITQRLRLLVMNTRW